MIQMNIIRILEHIAIEIGLIRNTFQGEKMPIKALPHGGFSSQLVMMSRAVSDHYFQLVDAWLVEAFAIDR